MQCGQGADVLADECFDSFGIGIQFVHIRCSHHNNDVVQKHLLILGTQIVQKFLRFQKAVLQVFADDI